jgi:O-antigen/teichoic acid export membrane protein
MLGFTLVSFAMSFQTCLISMPYTIYSPRLKDSAHARYTGSTLIHQIALSMLIMVVLTIAERVLSQGVGPQDLLPVLRALIVVIPFMLLWEYARRVCFAALQMKTALIIDSCAAALQICGLLLLAYLGLLSPSRAYWVIGYACGITAIGWLISKRKSFMMHRGHVISDLRQNWSIGYWIFASSVLYIISTDLYPWFLVAFHGPTSAGVWAVCLGTVAISNPIFLALQNSLSPRIAHAYAEGGSEVLRGFSLRAATAFGLAISPFCAVQLIFGSIFVTLLYGDKYDGNGLVVSMLALNMFVSALAFSPSRALFTIDRANVEFKINFSSLIVLFSVGLWLVRSFGPFGAASGMLLGNLIGLILRYFAFSRLVRSQSEGR